MAVVTPKRIAIAVGVIVFFGLIAYFRYVGTFSPLLTPEQQKTIATQDEIIADLEAQNEKAEREVEAAKAAQVIAERKEGEARDRLAQRNREISAWVAKYAELKSRPAQLVTKADEARATLRQMGWSQ